MSDARTTEILEDEFGPTDTAPAAAPVTVAATAGGTVIAAANASRKEIVLQNNGTVPCVVRLGGDPSTTAYNFVLSAATAARDGLGGSITLNTYTGAIKGITPSATTIVSVIELVED